jgi:hypothetical protein
MVATERRSSPQRKMEIDLCLPAPSGFVPHGVTKRDFVRVRLSACLLADMSAVFLAGPVLSAELVEALKDSVRIHLVLEFIVSLPAVSSTNGRTIELHPSAFPTKS